LDGVSHSLSLSLEFDLTALFDIERSTRDLIVCVLTDLYEPRDIGTLEPCGDIDCVSDDIEQRLIRSEADLLTAAPTEGKTEEERAKRCKREGGS
jgi:hypothetical protein